MLFRSLAIDERRKPFQPAIWERQDHAVDQTVEQVWFAGVHSNIGGGYAPDGLANEALHWMAEKAEGLGLELDHAYLKHFKPCFNARLHDSVYSFRIISNRGSIVDVDVDRYSGRVVSVRGGP